MSTIFSKIIDREIPAEIVYEDDVVLAFLDIEPVNPGHTLVIPKTPSTDLTATDPETLAHLMGVVQEIATAQRHVLGATGNNVIFNCGSDGGQEVFHTHAHVVPRHPGDNAYEPPHKQSYGEGKAATVAKQLRDGLVS